MYKLKVYYLDDEKDGRIRCEFNDCFVFKIPSEKVSLDFGPYRDEIHQSGDYILFRGTDAYVGQASKRQNANGIIGRIQEPHKSIDPWDTALVIVKKTDDLDDTKISYLERSLYDVVSNSKYHTNQTIPGNGGISSQDKYWMDDFLKDIKRCLDILGYSFKKTTSSSAGLSNVSRSPRKNSAGVVFDLVNKKLVAHVRMESDGKFTLLAGSDINPNTKPSMSDGARKTRAKNAALISGNKTTADIVFESSSSAGDFVLGYSVNGNVVWKTADGKAPKDFKKQ